MSRKNDMFADIAQKTVKGGNGELYRPGPVEKNPEILPMEGCGIFTPEKEMSGREELYTLVDDLKKHYVPFLENLAPPMKATREIREISRFDYRLEGDESWKEIKIPHYDGPLGEQTAYYRTEFTLEKIEESQSFFICFKGVDYIAEVFVNGHFAGSHKGFFAPFEFDCTPYVKDGDNTLLVKVKNDYIWMGNIDEKSRGKRYEGEKIYAATGPGYDDPDFGWHHCPPGFGIYQGVRFEVRNRLFINDIFVRPAAGEERAELRIEVTNLDRDPLEISILLSLFGQNFKDCVFEDREFIPKTGREYGRGDSFTEQNLIAQGLIDKPVGLLAEKGVNIYTIPLEIENPRIWEPETPYLYQIQASVTSGGKIVDGQKQHFGMRDFVLDRNCTPKGMFYLNGRKIRLRGANTMGHEQQCVMKGDFDQLLTDLLLAKACNMNFLRFTQRPVQDEIYDLCDKLGLMVQTDMPLFAVIRRGAVCELLKQTEEMERLVRNHPSCILVSYINEPMPNANNKPHRHLSRGEMNDYFTMADSLIRMVNPDRVTKHVDGDYDPPSSSLPDNHCYNMWYNGHGLDLGELIKGYWQYVRRGWNYGCGEFGVEGLEELSIMREYYPRKWLEGENGSWDPSCITGAQTGSFHYLFYKTPETMEEWVEASQNYQAEGIRVMTEAFRRDPRMVSFALHLFIDAFPSGWMKTIMDVKRNPKKGFFAYRKALEPMMVSLRTDRTRFFSGDPISIEAWICNDTNRNHEGFSLRYYIEGPKGILSSGSVPAALPDCSSYCRGTLSLRAPETDRRIELVIRMALFESGSHVSDTSLIIDVFPQISWKGGRTARIFNHHKSTVLADHCKLSLPEKGDDPDIILIEDFSDYEQNEKEILRIVREGGTLFFLELEPGVYTIDSSQVKVRKSSMMPVHFTSPEEGSLLDGRFFENDFRYWYEPGEDRIMAVLYSTFRSDDFETLLASGNTDDSGEWGKAAALATKSSGRGRVIISQLDLSSRLTVNPVAEKLMKILIEGIDNGEN